MSEIDAIFVSKINKIKEEFDKEFEKMKKGGKRRGKIGGGFCNKHQFQYAGPGECPICKNARSIRKNRRSKSRRRTFAKLKIKNPTRPEEEAYNTSLDELDKGDLTPKTKQNAVRKAIGTSVALKNYKNARWWWRLFQLRYMVLELIFWSIGGLITERTYWTWVWVGEYLQFFVDASVPSEMRKQLRKTYERELADSQRDLRRRMRDGFRELRSQNIEDGKYTEEKANGIENRLTDYAESENPQLSLPMSPGQNPSPSPSPTETLSLLRNSIGEGIENFRDFNIELFDGLEDGAIGTYRFLQDTKDEIGKPITTGGDVIHELVRGFNNIGPLFLTILMISYLLRRTIPVKKDLNTWPEEPLFPFPDDPRGDPKGDGKGPGTSGAQLIRSDGTHVGGRKHRKKTRRKRRKTRRKSKKRKSKRRRKNRKTKRRKRRR